MRLRGLLGGPVVSNNRPDDCARLSVALADKVTPDGADGRALQGTLGIGLPGRRRHEGGGSDN